MPQAGILSTIIIHQNMNPTSEKSDSTQGIQINTGNHVEAAYRDFHKILQWQTLAFSVKTASDEEKFNTSITNADFFAFRFKIAIANPNIRKKFLLWQKAHYLTDGEMRMLLGAGVILLTATKFEVPRCTWLGLAGTIQMVFSALICSFGIMLSAVAHTENFNQLIGELFFVTFWCAWSYFIFKRFLQPARILTRIGLGRNQGKRLAH